MLHIIQNDPEVPPGNIAENLEDAGILYLVHHPYCGDPLPDLQDITALIVLGGSMGANDDRSHPFLYDLKLFIRRVVEAGIPYLGICLGGQLLAAALGAQVVSNRWEELGSLPVELNASARGDVLFSGVPEIFSTFQWHHDSFDIPTGAVLLASSTNCPHQAFRIGGRAWGTQFHPEVTERIIRDWCAWDHATAARIEELLAAFGSIRREYRDVARRFLWNFLSSAGFGMKTD
jgi:GMP synthase-like glutamine amidotransferase